MKTQWHVSQIYSLMQVTFFGEKQVRPDHKKAVNNWCVATIRKNLSARSSETKSFKQFCWIQ